MSDAPKQMNLTELAARLLPELLTAEKQRIITIAKNQLAPEARNNLTKPLRQALEARPELASKTFDLSIQPSVETIVAVALRLHP